MLSRISPMLSAPVSNSPAVCAPVFSEVHSPGTGQICSSLEQLLQQLSSHRLPSDQIRTTLETIRELTGADVVCWYSPNPGESLAVAGFFSVPAEPYNRFIQQLLAMATDGESTVLWESADGAASAPGEPRSAAMIQPSKSNPSRIVALSFTRPQPFQSDDVQLMKLAARLLQQQHRYSRATNKLQESMAGLLRSLVILIDAKDNCTYGHSERVSRIAVRIGQEMKLPTAMINDLHVAGLLHDVGKIGVRDEVLLKPGKLTAAEYAHIQDHTRIGDQIVSQIPQFARLRSGVRHHHERFDGKGYPDGIAGEDIPLLARILAVADSCDALMSPRRYRSQLTPPEIDAEFSRLAGQQWDPKVIEHFMRCRNDIYPPIYQKGIGDSAEVAIYDIVLRSSEGASSLHLKSMAAKQNGTASHGQHSR
jgi:hypothetical protein